MISDKQTNKIYFSDLLRTVSKYSETCGQITKILDSFKIQYDFLPKTKDIWARDYMPIQITEDRFIEYRYDPDYLQGKEKGNRDLKTYPDMVCDSINRKTTKTEIILDGGNVIKSKSCIIRTDKIVTENRLLCNKTELIKRLEETFEVDNVILIPQDKEEVIYGHSDGMVRFIDDETVLIHEIYESDETMKWQLKQHGLKWEYLKFKVKRYHKDNWAYINFLQTKNLILLPKMNIDEDEQAFAQIQMYYPEYAERNRIIQVDATKIVEQDGAFNCISWTIKSNQ